VEKKRETIRLKNRPKAASGVRNHENFLRECLGKSLVVQTIEGFVYYQVILIEFDKYTVTLKYKKDDDDRKVLVFKHAIKSLEVE